MLEYKKLMNISDEKKNVSMAAQNNFQDLHKDAKDRIPKEPTAYFILVQTNDQRTRNQPIFTSAHIFDHKKRIFTVYKSQSA